MTIDQYKEGHIVRYAYLWKWQRDLGRDEGEKDRPACVALTFRSDAQNLTHLVMLCYLRHTADSRPNGNRNSATRIETSRADRCQAGLDYRFGIQLRHS